MLNCTFFTCLDHLLQRSHGRSNQNIVIAISKYAHKNVVYPASSRLPFEDGEEVIGIETVEYSGQNRPLPDAVHDGKKT